jgi:hypothetical protein
MEQREWVSYCAAALDLTTRRLAVHGNTKTTSLFVAAGGAMIRYTFFARQHSCVIHFVG